MDSTLLGLFDKHLDTHAGKCGIAPGAYLWVVPPCRHGDPDHVCRYLKYVSFPDVSALTTQTDMSPCHMCLL